MLNASALKVIMKHNCHHHRLQKHPRMSNLQVQALASVQRLAVVISNQSYPRRGQKRTGWKRPCQLCSKSAISTKVRVMRCFLSLKKKRLNFEEKERNAWGHKRENFKLKLSPWWWEWLLQYTHTVFEAVVVWLSLLHVHQPHTFQCSTWIPT